MTRHPGGLEPDIPADLLDLSPQEFRRLGHWVVDRTAQHLATLRDRPAITTGAAHELAAALDLPGEPDPVEVGLALLADVALEHQQHGDHPRYFARVPGPSSHVAILGEWLATGMQAIASSWGGGSGTAMLELIALDRLRDALGLAPGSEGVLLSGGSMANTTALIVARAETGLLGVGGHEAGGHRAVAREPVLWLSDQTHSSIARGAVRTGWPAERVRVLPTDATGALDVSALAEAVDAGPGIVVATAGTTNTGAVDDLPAIAAICRAHGLWLHVDGAYGGPAALTPGRAGIAGLALADSFVLDPHKWLFQPYDIGCLWVARPGALERTFAMHPEYLRDAQGGRVDLHNRSLELTRRSRAAKLWLTLRSYGLDTLAAAVQRGIELAEAAQALIADDPRLTVVTPARLGVVTFAIAGSGDGALPGRVAAAVTADGYAALTSTMLHGRPVLRLCTINPRTTVAEIAGTLELVAAAAQRLRRDDGAADGSPAADR